MKANKIWNKYVCPTIEWTFYGLAIVACVLGLYTITVMIAVI